jgi:hypothetical protein
MGVADRTGEVIIGTKDGVIKARDIRSMEEKEAWDMGKFNDIRGTPWEPVPGREGIEIRSRVVIPVTRTEPGQLMEGEDRDFIVRRMRINRETIRKLGFTIGCPGCRAVNRGQSAVNHNEACRSRVEGLLREAGNETILRADERIRERNEERDNKRRTVAAGNADNADRGGVEQQQPQQQQEDATIQEQQQQQQDHEMEEAIGSIECQVADMTGWDFNEKSVMKESMETIKGRKARAIIVSAVDSSGNQVNKIIKCANEQGKRGLYYAV